MTVCVLSDLTWLPLLGVGESHGILLLYLWIVCINIVLLANLILCLFFLACKCYIICIPFPFCSTPSFTPQSQACFVPDWHGFADWHLSFSALIMSSMNLGLLPLHLCNWDKTIFIKTCQNCPIGKCVHVNILCSLLLRSQSLIWHWPGILPDYQ